MVATTRSATRENPGAASMAILADLITIAREHDDPDRRLDALQKLVIAMPAPAMVTVLIDRLRHDRDSHVLWLCVGWLLGRYGEDKATTTTILARLEAEPNAALRTAILRLVSIRLGSAEPVRRTVGRVAAGDPDRAVRAEAAQTLAELERLRFSPPDPAPVSHSSRQLEAWAAVEICQLRTAN